MKRHKTKVSDRYFTYIYVRVRDNILLRKRTGDDIWRNLYELPLIETQHPMEEHEVLAWLCERKWLPKPGEGVAFSKLCQGVRHNNIYAQGLEQIRLQNARRKICKRRKRGNKKNRPCRKRGKVKTGKKSAYWRRRPAFA